MIITMYTSEKNQSPLSYFQHENILMPKSDLPIVVRFRQSNEDSYGCEFHWHEELEFYYVKKGSVLLLCNGKEQWIKAGEIGFVNWCNLHRGLKFSNNTEHYIVQIGTDLFTKESMEINGVNSNYLSVLISEKIHFPLVFSDCQDMSNSLDQIISINDDKSIGHELRLKAAVFNLLASLVEKCIDNVNLPDDQSISIDAHSLDHVKKILFYISCNYMNSNSVNLSELAAKFGLSIPYLCRIFKQYTNMTIISYLQELRCKRAASFIRNGVPLDKVANLIGYEDYNYFSRVFKKVMGEPPSQYK